VLLAQFPEMSEMVPHLGQDVRRHCQGNYLIFYVPIESGIELRRILHGARRIENLFD
jgi:plasmid stabilization system protein ParE